METATETETATVPTETTVEDRVFVDPIPAGAYLLAGVGLLIAGQVLFERGLDFLVHGKPIVGVAGP